MDKDKLSQFADRIFADMAGSMSAGLAFLGVETGLFRAMAGQGPLSAQALTEQTGLQPRYVLEWLRGMVAAGYLEYDPAAETYTLPDEHAFLLASEGTDHYTGGLFYGAVSNLSVAPQVGRAFREGGGVPFDDFPGEMFVGLDLMSQGVYEQRLATEWLAEMPDVVTALEAGGSALDVGCGAGRVSQAIARAFPQAHAVGLDLHPESVARAQRLADEAGLGGGTEFIQGSVDALPADRTFDLITCCDVVHDLAEPEQVLGQVRERLAPGGTLMVIEPKVNDRLEENTNPVATMFYGFSVFHCMTQSLARGGPGLGACMGPAKLEQLLRKVGFGQFRALPIRSKVNRFFEAKA